MPRTAALTAGLMLLRISSGSALATHPIPPIAGYLGLASDAYGVYHEPSPALASLHEDYHFYHHHQMAEGRLELDSVTSFGSSAHIKMSARIKPRAAGAGATNATLTLAVCGGDTTVEFAVAVPPPRVCATQKIENNSNSAGWTSQTVKQMNHTTANPAECQTMCCHNPLCSGFTYTDPQPHDPTHKYMCWMME